MRPIHKLLLGYFLGGFILSGCGGGTGSAPQVNRDKTLIVHISSDLTGMNPPIVSGATEDYIHQLIFDKILALDFKTLELRPTLSDAMPEVSEDKSSYTFHLKPNLAFSDKHPLEAEDVVFSFKTIFNPFVSAAPVRADLNSFSDCIALDAHTVKFVLKTPGPRNLDKLAINFFVMPRHIYDPENLTSGYSAEEGVKACNEDPSVAEEKKEIMKRFAEAFADNKFQRVKGSVLGSGRYVFDDWVTGQSIRLVKNENYWNKESGDPFAMQGTDTLIFKVINDNETALIALKNGEIDFSDRLDPSQLTELKNNASFLERFQIKTIPYPNYEYIGWNLRIKDQPGRDLFNDKKVRMALSQLVDPAELIQTVMYGMGTPITSMVYSERPEYNKTLKVIEPNEEKAKASLYEAGWEDTNGDGILDKEIGEKLISFRFKLYYRNGNEVRKNIALLIKERFKRAGIEVEPAPLEWSVMKEKLNRHELDAWLAAWVFDSNEQDFFQIFHSSQVNNEGFNWTSYRNVEADSLMEAIQGEYDQQSRFRMHERVQQIIWEDQPYTLLFGNVARIVYNRRVDSDNFYGQRPCYDLPQFVVRTAKTQ